MHRAYTAALSLKLRKGGHVCSVRSAVILSGALAESKDLGTDCSANVNQMRRSFDALRLLRMTDAAEVLGVCCGLRCTRDYGRVPCPRVGAGFCV